MANTFSTTTFVARAMTELFDQKSPLINTANRTYVGQFSKNNGYAPGSSINIKDPGYQSVTTGLVASASGITDKIISFTTSANDIYSIVEDLDLYSEYMDVVGGRAALTDLGKGAIVDNYCTPNFLSLESRLEVEAATRMAKAAYITPIDTPAALGSINSYSDVSQVEELMTDLKYSPMGRVAMMNPGDARQIADSLQNSFQPVLNKNITQTARIGGPDKGRLASFDMYISSDISNHIVGEQYDQGGAGAGKSFTVGAVAVDGTTITFAGVGSVTSRLFKAGDRISIPSVTLLDRVSKVARKWKLVVTVAADANGDGAGNCQVTLSEPLIASGMNANVSAIPAVSAAAELFPSHKLNFFYVPSGLSVVPLQLKDIEGASNSNVTYKANQIPVKVVSQGSVTAYSNTFRTSLFCPIKAFAGYIVVLPSAI